MPRMIIVEATEAVACPKCSHAFVLSEGISRQAIERHAEDFEHQLAQRGRDLEANLAAEAKRRAERETAQAREAFELEIRSAREALAAKDGALERFRADELALRRRLREADDARKNQELDYQKKLDDERKRIQEAARASLADEFGRREAQMRVQMESVQRELADAKRKLEQGSQQLQGEALECSLEELLRAAFPLDEIVEVAKGVKGADLLQRVRSPSGALCGMIVWEAKQTKAFQPAWLQKLKDDQQAVGAELAVLVTSAMPKQDGGKGAAAPFMRQADVWITSFPAARPLAEALRATLVELHKLRQANLGRSEKMALVYEYITSPQFARRVKSVVEGFRSMREELEAERAAMTRIWKKREMHLARMTGGILGVVGDLQGIGEEDIEALETIAALPESTERRRDIEADA